MIVNIVCILFLHKETTLLIDLVDEYIDKNRTYVFAEFSTFMNCVLWYISPTFSCEQPLTHKYWSVVLALHSIHKISLNYSTLICGPYTFFRVRFTLYKAWRPLDVDGYVKWQFIWTGGDNPKLEQFNIVVNEEMYTLESISQRNGSREEAIRVEFTSH